MTTSAAHGDTVNEASIEATPDPFKQAAKVVGQVQLTSVRFGDFSAQVLQTAIPDEAEVSVAVHYVKPIVHRHDHGFSTRTTLVCRMAVKVADGHEEPIGVIRASFRADYVLAPKAPKFADADLVDFALCYCPFHVWGYWREFVQSSLARLDLPPITLPLFRIAQAPKMVRASLD